MEAYNPYTNVLRIHYITNKLLMAQNYENNKSKQIRLGNRNRRLFHKELLQYNFATHVLFKSDYSRHCHDYK